MTEIRPAAQNRARRAAKAEKIAVRTVSGFVKAVFLIGFCFAVLYPLMTILSKSFMGRMDLFDNTVILVPKTFTLQNYQIAAMLMGYGEALVNTATLSTIVMLLETASCLLVAYGLARFRFRLRGLFLVLVVFTLIVPPQLILVPMVVQFSRYDPLGICTLLFGGSLNLIDSFLPFGLLAATAVGVKNGLFILIFFQFFRNMPRELEEAAYIDGAGPVRAFLRIMLPGARTMMVTVFLFGFVWTWLDIKYIPTLMPDMPLLVTEVQKISSLGLDASANTVARSLLVNAGAVYLIVPLVLLYLFTQRYFVQSIERSGLVG